MALDTYNRYTGTGRPVNDMGETTPEIEVSESVRPWGKFLPAPYLPVGRFDVHKRANVVLSVGTPVGFDKQGSLIPAGIPDGHTFEFDSDDYRTGMFATRNPLTGAAITSATTEAAMHHNLLGTSGVASPRGDVKFARAAGVTSYNVFSHEGGVSFTLWPDYTLGYANPVNYAQHNTMAQDLVAITCDYCLLVPYLPGKNLLGDATKIFDNTANGVDALTKKAKSYVFAHDELVTSGTGTVFGSGMTCVFVSPRCGVDDNGLAAAGYGVEVGGITSSAGDTAVTFAAPGDTAGSAVNCSEVGLHVVKSNDPAKYVVLKNTSSWETGVADSSTLTGEGIATSGNITLVLENPICPGDFVVPRIGKFVKYNAERHEVDEICGQVLAVDSNVTDKSYLSRVKSAYERASSAGDMMPGSATRGVPFNLHMVTDGAFRQYTKQQKLDGTTIAAAGLTTPALRLVTINLLK